MGGTISFKVCTIGYCGRGGHIACTERNELSVKEKDIIRVTWAKLQDRSDEISVDIFLKIFDLVPYAKQFFPFRDVTGNALLKHPYFKGHAKRFFNALRMTVVNMDAWEIILIPNLLQLGRQHANINGFKHEYFDLFSEAMNDVFRKHLGRAYNTETRTAWSKISNLITSTVEQGYREGQKINLQRANQQNMSDPEADGTEGMIPTKISSNEICPAGKADMYCAVTEPSLLQQGCPGITAQTLQRRTSWSTDISATAQTNSEDTSKLVRMCPVESPNVRSRPSNHEISPDVRSRPSNHEISPNLLSSTSKDNITSLRVGSEYIANGINSSITGSHINNNVCLKETMIALNTPSGTDKQTYHSGNCL